MAGTVLDFQGICVIIRRTVLGGIEMEEVADNALQVIPESVQKAMDVLCPPDKVKAVMEIDAHIERLRSAEREAEKIRDQASRKLEEIRTKACDEVISKIKHINKEHYYRPGWSSRDPDVYKFDLVQTGQIPASIAPIIKKLNTKGAGRSLKDKLELRRVIEEKIRAETGVKGKINFADGFWQAKEPISVSIDLSKNEEFNKAKKEFDIAEAACSANMKATNKFYEKLRTISIGRMYAY